MTCKFKHFRRKSPDSLRSPRRSRSYRRSESRGRIVPFRRSPSVRRSSSPSYNHEYRRTQPEEVRRIICSRSITPINHRGIQSTSNNQSTSPKYRESPMMPATLKRSMSPESKRNISICSLMTKSIKETMANRSRSSSSSSCVSVQNFVKPKEKELEHKTTSVVVGTLLWFDLIT